LTPKSDRQYIDWRRAAVINAGFDCYLLARGSSVASEPAAKLKLSTVDLAEAIAAVSHVYCPHEVKILGSNRGVKTTLEALEQAHHRIVSLRYSAPVHIDAGNFDNLMLMMTCVGGSAQAAQGRYKAQWHRGQTLPFSPNARSHLKFDREFGQRSVRLDIDSMEALCSRLLNCALDRPLQLELRPFAPELETTWQEAVRLLLKYDELGIALPPAAALHLEEFIGTLILERHPHNYSDALSAPCQAATPRIVKEAEYLMRAEQPEAVSLIAKKLGVSLRTLELGFRECRQSTPTQFLRQIRLDAARADLRAPSASTTVTSVALANGFPHLARFSSYYRSAFDEYPSQTLGRSRKRAR
jgi:AraC-like DNA-binding protein